MEELGLAEVKGGAKSSDGVNRPRGTDEETEGGGSLEDNWAEGGDRVSPAAKEGGPAEESAGTLGERPLKRDDVPCRGNA